MFRDHMKFLSTKRDMLVSCDDLLNSSSIPKYSKGDLFRDPDIPKYNHKFGTAHDFEHLKY